MTHRIALADLKSAAPYSQSRAHDTKRREKETADAYEKRTWPLKAHVNEDGSVVIPAMALKMAVDAAAKYLSLQIPGRGKATYTKHFTSGCLVLKPADLGITLEDCGFDLVHANADGVRGSGKRVWRYFPKIEEWCAEVEFHLHDDAITQEIFEQVLKEAGKFIGIGRFRPQNGGMYGRFTVEGVTWLVP